MNGKEVTIAAPLVTVNVGDVPPVSGMDPELNAFSNIHKSSVLTVFLLKLKPSMQKRCGKR